MEDNIFQFPTKKELGNKQEAKDYNGLSLREHFDHFLMTLDKSVETFHELSAYEKLSLYMTLVDFTRTSLDSYAKLKEKSE